MESMPFSEVLAYLESHGWKFWRVRTRWRVFIEVGKRHPRRLNVEIVGCGRVKVVDFEAIVSIVEGSEDE
jgi:hypothetical protein